MKALIVKASGNRNSNSSGLVDALVEKLDITDTESFLLNDFHLKGCTGCRACKNADTLCVVNDEMKTYFSKLSSCDIVIFSSPNYMGTINGQLKMVYDRHYCLTDIKGGNKLENIKKAYLVMSQGYDDTTYYMNHYEDISKVFSNQLNADVRIVVHAGKKEYETCLETI